MPSSPRSCCWHLVRRLFTSWYDRWAVNTIHRASLHDFYFFFTGQSLSSISCVMSRDGCIFCDCEVIILAHDSYHIRALYWLYGRLITSGISTWYLLAHHHWILHFTMRRRASIDEAYHRKCAAAGWLLRPCRWWYWASIDSFISWMAPLRYHGLICFLPPPNLWLRRRRRPRVLFTHNTLLTRPRETPGHRLDQASIISGCRAVYLMLDSGSRREFDLPTVLSHWHLSANIIWYR